MNAPAPRRFHWVAAFLLLNALAAVRFPWENVSWAGTWLRIGPDLGFVFAAGFVLRRLRLPSRWVAWLAAFVVVMVPLFRFGMSIMPVVYGKEFDLYEDLFMVPGLVHLLTHSYSTAVQWLIFAGMAILAGAFFWLVQRACLVFARLADHRRAPRVAAATLLVGTLGCGAFGWLPGETSRLWASPPVLPAAVLEVGEWPTALEQRSLFEARLEQARARLQSVPDDLAGLGSVDVHVLFLESYGRALFRDAGVAARIEGWAEDWQGRLERSGMHAVSGSIFPSVSGGGSSLAHAEFHSGISVPHRRAFQWLLDSDLTPLPRRFVEMGYEAYNVQPAMTEAWPEGRRFFGFTQDVFQEELEYAGHAYHWGVMPDQYALQKVLRDHVKPAQRPVFVQYISVTSHAPFTWIPPFIEPGPDALKPGAFLASPAKDYGIHWGNYVGHPQIEEAYLETIHYALRCSVDYATQLPRDSLVLILGDHQPPVIGEWMERDATYDVPLHVLSHRPELLAPLLPLGFEPGFVLSGDAPTRASHQFLGAFLALFSSNAPKDS